MMSNVILEDRVGKVETELARQGERIGHIEASVGKVAEGVDKLLDRDARRPEPISFSKIIGTALSTLALVAALWGAVGWLVEASPAMKLLSDRVTDLDHAKRGRVTAAEERLRSLEAWSPTVIHAGGKP